MAQVITKVTSRNGAMEVVSEHTTDVDCATLGLAYYEMNQEAARWERQGASIERGGGRITAYRHENGIDHFAVITLKE